MALARPARLIGDDNEGRKEIVRLDDGVLACFPGVLSLSRGHWSNLG
jgi:hypothetical protein